MYKNIFSKQSHSNAQTKDLFYYNYNINNSALGQLHHPLNKLFTVWRTSELKNTSN